MKYDIKWCYYRHMEAAAELVRYGKLVTAGAPAPSESGGSDSNPGDVDGGDGDEA
jgi:hypothetical protein